MDVDSTVAVVTGGASGIGRATAVELARRGADIVIGDVHDERIDEVRTEIETLGRRFLGVHCDVSQDADVQRLRDEAIATMGHVDIVMLNAGVAMLGPAEGLSIDEWKWIFDINFFGVVRGVQAFVPHLLERGSGYLVATSSVAGLFAYAWDHPTYIAAKHAVLGLTESLALYLKPNGIGVSVLCPSLVATNIAETARMGGVDDISRWIREVELSAPIAPEVVGTLVADAIRDERYLILTDPDAIRPVIAARGADPDAFVQAQIAQLPEPPNLYRD
jgi:NAD(P)-dependent dehydrogenase (short-subunit alcohol dehydrogenase family)